MPLITPDDAFDFIIQYEGMDQPSIVPPEESGVTLGHGYDLRFHSVPELRRDWGPHLAPAALDRLALACGAGHERALELAKTYRDIKITRAMADAVLLCVTLPLWIGNTMQAYPGLEDLPGGAQVAVVSCAFNRGLGFGEQGKSSWERRREMRELKPVIQAGDLGEIARLIRSMKRLWAAGSGLVTRREAEAQLVESCAEAQA